MLGGVGPRFWSKVAYTEGCWLWIGSRNGKGYGQYRLNGKIRRAHRVSYESHRGPIPNGLVLDHRCCNTSCVNPLHLEVATVGENNRRGMAPNHVARRAGTCQKGHAMTPYANGRTQCKECRKARDRKAVA